MTENPLFTATLLRGGQITIPKEIRQKKGLREGDMIDVYDLRKATQL